MVWERTTVERYMGWLCVRWESADFARPEKVAHFWPVRVFVPDTDADLLGLTAGRSVSGVYTCYDPKACSAGRWHSLPLRDGGQTTPIHTETSPWHCPKTRKGTETRYFGGNWQAYTKTHGWRNIGTP